MKDQIKPLIFTIIVFLVLCSAVFGIINYLEDNNLLCEDFRNESIEFCNNKNMTWDKNSYYCSSLLVKCIDQNSEIKEFLK